MAVASAIIAGVGTLVSAGGALAQANAQAQAARYQQQVAQNLAKYTLEAGQVEEQAKRMETNAMLGQQRAAQAASGVELNTGSALAVRTSTQALGELDALTIRNNAIARANAQLDQATLYGMEASSAQAAGWWNATSNILEGASSFGAKWSSYQTKGLLT